MVNTKGQTYEIWSVKLIEELDKRFNDCCCGGTKLKKALQNTICETHSWHTEKPGDISNITVKLRRVVTQMSQPICPELTTHNEQ